MSLLERGKEGKKYKGCLLYGELKRPVQIQVLSGVGVTCYFTGERTILQAAILPK